MIIKCKSCGVKDKEWVIRRLDGSNVWSLDLDLHAEYPEVWGSTWRARVLSNGVCTHCIMLRNKDLQ